MAEGAESVAAELVGRLERAWNGADGRAFGEPFAPDADFVDIRGEHHRDLRGQPRRLRADGGQGAFGRRYPGPRNGVPQGPVRSPRRRAQLAAKYGPGSRRRRVGDRRFPQHARGVAAAIAGRASPSPFGFF